MGGLFSSQAAAAAEVGDSAVIAVHSVGEWTHNWQSHTQNNKMVSRWPTNPSSLAFSNRIHKSGLCPPLDHPFDLFASSGLLPYGKMVIDFSASWCGPYRFVEPAFRAMAAQYTDAVFLDRRWRAAGDAILLLLIFRAIDSWFDLGFRSSRCVGGVEAVEGAGYVVVRAGERRAGGGKSRRRDEGRAREEDPGAAQHLKEE